MQTDALRAQIWRLRRLDGSGYTWEEIRRILVDPNDLEKISRSLVWKVANVPEYEPRDLDIRAALGLDQESSVRYVDGRPRPRAQALDVMVCGCGRHFVSNHPRRRKCFVCSPYRGKSKKGR